MLDRPHAPGAAVAGLHLVDDEHDAVLVADPADALDEFRGRDDEAALPEHRLHHDRGHAFGRDLREERALQGGERGGRVGPAVGVRIGDPVDLGGKRPQAGLVRMRLRGHRHREHRAPVEGALEDDHRRPLRVRTRELDRVLDRLGTGVEERRLGRAAERGELDHALRQLDVDLVRDDREVGVGEVCELLLRRLDQAGVRVPDVQAADAAREVDERVAVDVRERGAAAFGDDDRVDEGQRPRDHAFLPLDDLLRTGARDRGPNLDRACHSHTLKIQQRSA